MRVPSGLPVTTNHLRASYANGHFSFGNDESDFKVCLIGSCRIVPILNYFRAMNSVGGPEFNLTCYNPVEMWGGVGTDVGECATALLSGHRIGRVNALVCESLKSCGALNTVDGLEENVFDTLGCEPDQIIRVPNWNGMMMYDAEASVYNQEYAAMTGADRVEELRRRTAQCYELFMGYCRRSSLNGMSDWVEAQWKQTRLGWTMQHVTRNLLWRMFMGVCENMGINPSDEVVNHAFCLDDPYGPTGTVLNSVDYAANSWEF